MARCRDCKLYDLDKVRSKSGAILSHRAAKCLWVSTETWPDSAVNGTNRRPVAGYMEPNEGQRCKRFIPRG